MPIGREPHVETRVHANGEIAGIEFNAIAPHDSASKIGTFGI